MNLRAFETRVMLAFVAVQAITAEALLRRPAVVPAHVLVGTGVAAGALAAFVCLRAYGRLVADVGRFAERIASGDLSARVAPSRPPQLAAVASSMNRMAEELARERRARAEFIGRVSHELRTPLTVIRGYAYTLARGETKPRRLEQLDVIGAECERLAYLVEDLLELSRSQAGELRIETAAFPLRACVEEVAERLRVVAEPQGVALDVAWSGNGALVMGDRNRLRQVFANLLTNGIKYAPPGTAVRVRGVAEGDELAVTVEDGGRGIAEADLPHVFDEFFRAGADAAEPGAGLGLAIARELTVAHGGRIEVESEPGAGARFTVRLPAWHET